MKLVGVIVVVAGCVVPPAQQQQTQPQYAQPQYGQPQPYAAQQPAPMASCQDTLGCYSQCNPMTQQCMTGCDQRTSPESQQNAHAVIQCMASSGCQDNNCVAQRCNAQVQACTNVTLAVQQPAAGPASQPSSGPLTVGPPTRQLTVADLQGAWQHDDHIMKSYVSSSTGTYAGYSVIADAEKWFVDAQGHMTDDYTGTHAGVGGTFQVNSNHAETLTISGDVFVRTPAKGDGIPRYYLIRGWEARPDITVFKIWGPAYQLDQIEARLRTDPNYGANMDEYWVRITK